MKYAEHASFSPNQNTGQTQKFLVVHHTAGGFDSAHNWIQNSAAKASYHWIIAPNGERYQYVNERNRAWHSGSRSSRIPGTGITDVNTHAIGLAFAGNTLEAPLTREQLDSFGEWFVLRAKRYGWTQANVFDHRQVDPTRRPHDLVPTEFARVFNVCEKVLV